MFISRKEYQSLVDANMYLLERKNNYMDEAYTYERKSIELEQGLIKAKSKLREFENKNVELQLEIMDKAKAFRQLDEASKELINKTVNLMEEHKEVVKENKNLRSEYKQLRDHCINTPSKGGIERW